MAPAIEYALSPDSVLGYMSSSLQPTNDQPQLLKDPYSSLALLSHACMLAVGFRLIGLGEDHKIGVSDRIIPQWPH